MHALSCFVFGSGWLVAAGCGSWGQAKGNDKDWALLEPSLHSDAAPFAGRSERAKAYGCARKMQLLAFNRTRGLAAWIMELTACWTESSKHVWA